MGNLIDKDKSVDLISKLQNGEISIQEERLLLAEIESRYTPHTQDNYLYDPNDLKSEYIMASWNALFRAKINIGDPISFACNRGRGAMLDYYRKISSEKLILYCPNCNCEYTYDRRNKFCKNVDCEYYQKEDILKSREKEELVSFDNNFNDDISIDDIYIEKIILNETLDAIIQYIENIKLGKIEKNMIIEAINHRQDFYDYAKDSGKSHSFSISFKKKVISILNPLKRFLD